SAGGITRLAAGAFTINGAIASGNVELNGGSLSGTNVIQGELNWVVGDWNSADAVTIAAGSVLHIVSASDHNLANCKVINNGTVAWSGGRVRGGGSRVTQVQNDGLWDAQSDEVLNDEYGGNNVTFSNAGVFRKSAG